ncbi:MAG: DNA primase [Candidatus Omnitrophica bacterium]|nr:DNA primase [Candidatus Omnitrophota bacterium]
MSGRIPENILEDILSRINIVEIISGFIPLKQAGRNFRALCPFHHEKTPSFMVSPDRQIYHCFGCGESGNAFKFLMRYERLEFPEAVEALAKKAGVALPQTAKDDQRGTSIAQQLYKINELTAIFYRNNLSSPDGIRAKNYLLKRGIKEDTLKSFNIGYAPQNWDGLINHLRQKTISLALMEKAGVILPREGGGYYDRFRNRIIFPITDIKSRVLGFGARVLDDTLPKYINSPETSVYTKGKNLYGLNLAKDGIRENDFAVIVEGYLDFIMPYQEGLTNIVASLGTALTTEQVRLLKRYTHNAVIIYDPDMAGELATLRSLDIFIEEEIDVKVVTLPKGFDPDSFTKQNGIEKLKDRIKHASNLFEYKLGILKSRYDIKEAEGKRDVVCEMLLTINKFKNSILKSEYIKRLSEELNIDEHYILEELNKVKDNRLHTVIHQAAPKKASNINPVEKLLIKLMLEEKELIETIRQHLEPADFQDEKTAKIVSIMFDLVGQGKNLEPNSLMNYFGEEEISQIICESMFLPEVSDENKEKVVSDCISRLRGEKLRLKKQHLHDRIKTAQHQGDEETLNKLIAEFDYLIKKG